MMIQYLLFFILKKILIQFYKIRFSPQLLNYQAD